MNKTVLLILTLLPVAVFLIQSAREASRANSLVSFFQYGDKLCKKTFWATLAASNSSLTAAIYVIAVYGYFYGIGIFIWVMSFWAITQWASHLTIKKVESVSSNKNGFLSSHGTLHEFLGTAYNSKQVRLWAAAASLICYIGLLCCELKLGHELIAGIWHSSPEAVISPEIDSWICLVVVIFLVVIYASISGFRGVIRTDKFQMALMVGMLLSIWIILLPFTNEILAGYPNHYAVSLSAAIINPGGEGVLKFLGLFVATNIIFWGVWWPGAMDQWHRCAAAGEVNSVLDKSFGTTGKLSTAYFALLTASAIMIGIAVRVLAVPTGGESAVIYHFLNWAVANSWFSTVVSHLLLGLIGAGLLCAVISTTDTYLIVATQSFVMDILQTKDKGLSLNQADKDKALTAKYLPISRKMIRVLYFVILAVLAVLSQVLDVYTMIYGFFCIMLASVPALVLALFGWRGSFFSAAALASITTSLIWTLISGSYIVVQINTILAAGEAESATYLYSLLYLNPIATLLMGFTVFIGFAFFRIKSISTASLAG